MKSVFKVATIVAVTLGYSVSADAQVEISAGADIVSSYVWRGAYQGMGAAVQPSLSVSYGILKVGAWGSTSIAANGGKEFDYYGSLSYAGFSLIFTDYWWDSEDSPSYFHARDMETGRFGHYYEGALGYDFGYFFPKFPLALCVSTIFASRGDKDEKGDSRYSTYIEASYPFSCYGLDGVLKVGVTPSQGLYNPNEGFNVSSISLRIAKSFEVYKSLSLGFYAEPIVSPAFEDVYFVFGTSVGF